MIVTAALAWWDEPPELLAECVSALGGIADRIVALDGAYRRYPGATPSSPLAQRDAIHDAARAAGIDCLILAPGRLWAGQVEKRTYLLTAASVGSDWLAIIDADHIVQGSTREAHAELATLDADIVTVQLRTHGDADRAATDWHRNLAGRYLDVAHFIRALPGLRVDGFHWKYSAVKDGVRVPILYDSPESQQLKAKRMESPYWIEHRTLQRDDAHILAGRAFCNDRAMVVERTGQEDHVEGLPEPVWDYATVPAG